MDVDLAIFKLLQVQVEVEFNGIELYSEEFFKLVIDCSRFYIIVDEFDGMSYYIDFKKGFLY